MTTPSFYKGIDGKHDHYKVYEHLHEGEATTSHHLLQYLTNKEPKSSLVNQPYADRVAFAVSSYHSGYLNGIGLLY